jgi:hypothetical protein
MWKTNHKLPLLQRCAKIILSVPVSSAAVERLFYETGLVLSKLRKKMKPATLSAMVYRKYATKSDSFFRQYDIQDICEEQIENYLSELVEVDDSD